MNTIHCTPTYIHVYTQSHWYPFSTLSLTGYFRWCFSWRMYKAEGVEYPTAATGFDLYLASGKHLCHCAQLAQSLYTDVEDIQIVSSSK